jgi:hypothetical protein
MYAQASAADAILVKMGNLAVTVPASRPAADHETRATIFATSHATVTALAHLVTGSARYSAPTLDVRSLVQSLVPLALRDVLGHASIEVVAPCPAPPPVTDFRATRDVL